MDPREQIQSTHIIQVTKMWAHTMFKMNTIVHTRTIPCGEFPSSVSLLLGDVDSWEGGLFRLDAEISTCTEVLMKMANYTGHVYTCNS